MSSGSRVASVFIAITCFSLHVHPISDLNKYTRLDSVNNKNIHLLIHGVYKTPLLLDRETEMELYTNSEEVLKLIFCPANKVSISQQSEKVGEIATTIQTVQTWRINLDPVDEIVVALLVNSYVHCYIVGEQQNIYQFIISRPNNNGPVIHTYVNDNWEISEKILSYTEGNEKNMLMIAVMVMIVIITCTTPLVSYIFYDNRKPNLK